MRFCYILNNETITFLVGKVSKDRSRNLRNNLLFFLHLYLSLFLLLLFLSLFLFSLHFLNSKSLSLLRSYLRLLSFLFAFLFFLFCLLSLLGLLFRLLLFLSFMLTVLVLVLLFYLFGMLSCTELEIKSLWKLEVELNSTTLMLSAKHIEKLYIDFRSVKCTISCIDFILFSESI